MKQLTHYDPTYPDRTAQAPYNFVQLPETVAKPADKPAAQDRYYVGEADEERHTGYWECTLTTASPLYTRCGVSLERIMAELGKEGGAQAKGLPDFLTNPATQEPMIAGSSIRGMLRTLVEIVGHGKMPDVTTRQLFYRTMDDSNVGRTYSQRVRDKIRGGIFHTDGQRYWIETCVVGRVTREDLQKAVTGGRYYYDGNRPNLTPSWRYQYKDVWVKLHAQAEEDLHRFRTVQAISLKTGGTTPQKGFLVITGDIPKKLKEFVFVRGSYGRVEVPEKLYRRFHDDDQLSQWQEKAFPKDKPASSDRTRPGYLTNGEPVFYLCDEEGNLVFFGRAGHFRLPYANSPFDMLPENLRSRSLDKMDIAETIFGYVDLETKDSKGKSKRVARGGRIFVSDARLVGSADNIWHEEIVPKVLSSPKPTSIQLYLTQQYPDVSKELFHYDSNPRTETTLRGHKLYWHKGNANISDIQAVSDDVAKTGTQFTKIRPVKSGTQFNFTIHFDNLSACELGILLWILDLASQPAYRLKLGMGKSLGMGSVAITTKLTLTDRQRRYTTLFDKQGNWDEGLESSEHCQQVAQQAKDAFAAWLVDEIHGNESSKQIEESPRIRALLTLLAWPGPAPAKTQHMTVLRADFAKRKVLPRAEVVAGLEPPHRGPQPPRNDGGGKGGGGRNRNRRGGGGNRNQGRQNQQGQNQGGGQRNRPQDQGPRRQTVHQDKPEQPRKDSGVAGDVLDFLKRKDGDK